MIIEIEEFFVEQYFKEELIKKKLKETDNTLVRFN